MKRVIAIVLVTIVACACPSKATKGGGGSGTGSNPGSAEVGPPPVGGCDAVKGKVEQLYRAEAQAKEPKRVEEAVADNTGMVMAECAKAPDTVSACISAAATLKDLETNCMPKLDDEGSEGKTLLK